MKELNQIQNHPASPVTVSSMCHDLDRLGVAPGMVLMVHSSLKSLGWVCGHAAAVIIALESVITPAGTLVMPTHSGDLSDPKDWSNPPVPESWKPSIRSHMPAFRKDLTQTRGMGAIPETFRKQDGVLRSDHPHVSFAAWGNHAKAITSDHALAFSLGDGSPLARVYELDGWVLLLGVGHDTNTSLHLAEYRAEFPGKKVVENAAPVLIKGKREWVPFEDIEIDEEDFTRLGADFETAHPDQVAIGRVGNATARLFRQRVIVDFAVEWIGENR